MQLDRRKRAGDRRSRRPRALRRGPGVDPRLPRAGRRQRRRLPGLPGWGAKSAAAVLARFEHLDAIPDDRGSGTSTVRGAAKLAATLAAAREPPTLFLDLATLRTTAEVGDVDDWRWTGATPELAAWAERLGAPELVGRAERLGGEALVGLAERSSPAGRARDDVSHPLRTVDRHGRTVGGAGSRGGAVAGRGARCVVLVGPGAPLELVARPRHGTRATRRCAPRSTTWCGSTRRCWRGSGGSARPSSTAQVTHRPRARRGAGRAARAHGADPAPRARPPRAHGRAQQPARRGGPQTRALAETTQSLREALSSTNARGQWGERMADDVLRLAGLRRGRELPSGTGSWPARAGARLHVPAARRALSLHMDVKFPLNNYLRFLDADRRRRAGAGPTRVPEATYGSGCVRSPLATTSTRRPSTVDCVLLFIPNEAGVRVHPGAGPCAVRRRAAPQGRVLLAAHAVRGARRRAPGGRQLPALADVAARSSPVLHGFEKQWGKFVEQMDKAGRSLRLGGAVVRGARGHAAARRRARARPDRRRCATSSSTACRREPSDGIAPSRRRSRARRAMALALEG